ncbi:CC0125/CC1285 family lipoprotein [Alteromonas confluentis]|uniref:DUF4136 domain-containing protein n=1 Tax=Alteromonas confluentis TaxID=1656094 RepID=A0A1E7ZBK6_9ALTE|nr:hypothetical protein [Alteromonas confluentis]OFC70903.1 hypothetical protein BFC18_10670 [Alteromonas confluentis]
MSFTASVIKKGMCYVVLGAGLLAATACSSVSSLTPTPYQAAKSDKQYGYSSTQLSDNEYRIMFRATEVTDASLVQEYSLYRAAEIAKKNDFQYLTIVKTDIERKNTVAKRIVKETPEISQNPILTDPQCTMSGCNEVGQTMPNQSGELRVQTENTEDVYYSILVRMAESQTALGSKSFEVAKLLARKPM